MCEKGWLVQLEQEGGLKVGGTVWGGTEKRERETKILKRGESWVKGWVP